MGFTPICKGCAEEGILKYNLSCKRYAISERKDGFLSPQCLNEAYVFFPTKDGYLPYCEYCIDEEDEAVTQTLVSDKYGEIDICNKYAEYIYRVPIHEREELYMIDMVYDETSFVERHEDPESQWYYMNCSHHIDTTKYIKEFEHYE